MGWGEKQKKVKRRTKEDILHWLGRRRSGKRKKDRALIRGLVE